MYKYFTPYIALIFLAIISGCGKTKEFSPPIIEVVIKADGVEQKLQSIPNDSTEHVLPISARKEYEIFANATDSTELQLLHIVFAKCAVKNSDAIKVEDSSLPHKKDAWNSKEDTNLGEKTSFKTIITSNPHFTAAEFRVYATDIFGNHASPVIVRLEVQ
jgi:hypothetical protein